ncbi:Tetratricopeptide repeat protein [Planctomycetes bacterium Pan216]|uniref:Tetratricopeptide repeat protein n=1 Tax=Kolteria novifilia TaxID=2527975 RepID=A0A518BB19_9BACT|nr:Tetratricopeptide repeat protein [Planctomycetes bacterium Pan216]
MAAMDKITGQLFNAGSGALQKKNYDFAVDCFFKCAKRCPDNVMFRQALRGAEYKKYNNNGKGAMMAGLKMKPAQMKLKAAKTRKRWAEAAEAAEEALKINPWDTGVLSELATCLQEMEHYPAAVWVMQSATSADPKNADLFKLLADMYEANNQFDEAINALEMVRRLNPENREAGGRMRQLAARATLTKQGVDESQESDEEGDGEAGEGEAAKPQPKAATRLSPEEIAERELRELEAKVKENPDDASTLGDLARRYRQQCKYEQAAKAFGRLYDLSDQTETDMKAQQLECTIEPLKIAQGKIKEAFSKLIRNAPDYMERAQKLKEKQRAIQVEQTKKELELFRFQTEINAENYAAHFELGFRLLQTRQYDEAIRALQEGCKDAKKKPEALMWTGVGFWKKKNYPLADRKLKEALESLSPGDDESRKQIYYYRGCVAQEKKDVDAAMEYFNEIAAMDYGYKDVAKRLEELAAQQEA